MGGLALNVQHCRRPLGSKTDPEQVFQLELLLASSLFVKLVPAFHFENFFYGSSKQEFSFILAPRKKIERNNPERSNPNQIG